MVRALAVLYFVLVLLSVACLFATHNLWFILAIAFFGYCIPTHDRNEPSVGSTMACDDYDYDNEV